MDERQPLAGPITGIASTTRGKRQIDSITASLNAARTAEKKPPARAKKQKPEKPVLP